MQPNLLANVPLQQLKQAVAIREKIESLEKELSRVIGGGSRPVAAAGLTEQSKERRLGIFAPTAETLKKARKQKRAKEFWIEILGRNVGTASSFELPRRRPGQGDRWPE